MVTFYNCGHGDCALIKDKFTHSDGSIEYVNLCIDLGPSTFNVPPAVQQGIDLLITHSDNDHCLGNAASLIPNRIFVPAFFAEMTVILYKLVNNENLSIQSYPSLAGKFIPVDEGHPITYSQKIQWEVFNPQKDLWKKWLPNHRITQTSKNTLDRFLRQNNIDTDINGLIKLVDKTRGFYSDDARNDNNDLESFVYAVLQKIYDYAQMPSLDRSFKKAISFFKHYNANEYSIVFKYIDSNNTSFLFTGDAPRKVFTKNYAGKNIQSQVLKVPHHGSASGFDVRNMQKARPFSNVLNQIQPDYMVVSHGDIAGGPPNLSVIKFLSQTGRQLYLTNDITANGTTLYHKVKVPFNFPNKIKAKIL